MGIKLCGVVKRMSTRMVVETAIDLAKSSKTASWGELLMGRQKCLVLDVSAEMRDLRSRIDHSGVPVHART